jgi:hypothetical protein
MTEKYMFIWLQQTLLRFLCIATSKRLDFKQLAFHPMLPTSHRAEHDVGFQLSLFTFAIHKAQRVLLVGKRNSRNPFSCRFEQLTAAQQGIIHNISTNKHGSSTSTGVKMATINQKQRA